MEHEAKFLIVHAECIRGIGNEDEGKHLKR